MVGVLCTSKKLLANHYIRHSRSCRSDGGGRKTFRRTIANRRFYNMAQITISLIKQLRDRTLASLHTCKMALIDTNGDIDKAADILLKSGQMKSAKIAGRVVNDGMVDGVIKVCVAGNYGVILEVNCETVFSKRSSDFESFVAEVLEATVADHISDIETLRAKFEEERVALVAKLGEDIIIRRIAILEGTELGQYEHDTRVGVLVSTRGADAELITQLTMHIAAHGPEYVKPEAIPDEVVTLERQKQRDIATQTAGTERITEKIVEGRMGKFYRDVSLTAQPFLPDPSRVVRQVLDEKGADVIDFIRFTIG